MPYPFSMLHARAAPQALNDQLIYVGFRELEG
jgi:hypothetical protein